jgi:hypothetical protein
VNARSASRVERLDERELRLDVCVTQRFVEAVRRVPRGAGGESHHRAPTFPSPDFRTIHKLPANAAPALASIYDKPTYHHECFGLDVLNEERMHPPHRAALNVRDEKLLVVLPLTFSNPAYVIS